MSQQSPISDQFWPLLNAACDDTLLATQVQELEAILSSDAAARRVFADHFQLKTDIRFLGQVTRIRNIGLAGIRATFPPAPPCSCPTPTFGSTTPYTKLGYFSSGWPMAYLVAMVIMGVGLAAMAVITVSPPTQITTHSKLSTEQQPVVATREKVVGRITGMVDCKWDTQGLGVGGWGPEKGPRYKVHSSGRSQSPVSLGDQFALASGLMEITYDTGAKVILQGPVAYEVESEDGGYLSLGKLSARVEKKEEGRTRTGEVPASRSSLLIAHSYFVVRTPTAVVTDLGTEFGVEVDDQGKTVSSVFRGSVEVRATTNGKSASGGRILRAGESAVVKNAGSVGDETDPVAMLAPAAVPPHFVRTLPKTTLKSLDLVDIVAGGDGFSGRRGRGIDPMTGRVVDSPARDPLHGDGQYHRVGEVPLVDGVFIPGNQSGPVQVDSAGHTFAGFLTSTNVSAEYLWAGGKVPIHPFYANDVHVRTELGGVDYASGGHGLIFLHANKGITFDLEAIRQANAGCKLVRFRSVAGNAECDSETGKGVYADVSVLVDGQVRFRRSQISSMHGAFEIALRLQANERFLTLVATDGGNGIASDWIIFGDPRLELLPSDARKEIEPR